MHWPWICTWLLLYSVSFGEVESELPPGVKKKLEVQVVPAYHAGNSLTVVRVLGPLVDRLDDQQRRAADALLQSYQLPAVEDLLLETRLALLPFEPDRRIPQPGREELRLLIRELGERIADVVDSNRPSDKQDIPGTLDRFARRFWEYKAAASQLDQAARLARYGHHLLTTVSRRGSDASRQREAAAFRQRASLLESKHQELDAAWIRLRLARLDLTHTILHRKTEYGDRLAAAFLMEADTDACRQLLEQPSIRRHDDLISAAVVAGLEERVHQLRASEPRLVIAARDLFRGLEWWMRGRYGLGPEGQGLLKSELALWSPEAQLGIYLPSEPPHPTVPGDTDAEPVPRFQRRHHFVWLCEYRQIESPLSVTSGGSDALDSNGFVQMSRYYSGADPFLGARNLIGIQRTNLRGIPRQLTADDGRKVNRLVGFLEYGKALEHLDAFVAEQTAEELQSLDHWIQLRDELALYTSLVPASLSPLRGAERNAASQPTEQRGLDWVMALARLEFAAMIATFTQVPQPFAAVRPSPYELPRYGQLVSEAFNEHFVALRQDEQLRRLARGEGTPTDLLRYGRRLVLTKALWHALFQQTHADGEAKDVYQLASKKPELDAIQQALLLRLDQFLQGRAGSATQETRFSYLWRDAENVRLFLQGN